MTYFTEKASARCAVAASSRHKAPPLAARTMCRQMMTAVSPMAAQVSNGLEALAGVSFILKRAVNAETQRAAEKRREKEPSAILCESPRLCVKSSQRALRLHPQSSLAAATADDTLAPRGTIPAARRRRPPPPDLARPARLFGFPRRR